MPAIRDQLAERNGACVIPRRRGYAWTTAAIVIALAIPLETLRAIEPARPMVEVDLVELEADEVAEAIQGPLPATKPTTEPIAKPEAESLPIAKPIQIITTSLRPPEGDVPPDFAAKVFDAPQSPDPADGRGWNETLFFWQASNLSHGPLYFEQRYVERYGYNFGVLQPAASAAQFYGTVPVLPLKMLRHPPREPIFAVEPARPGSFGARRPRY